MTFKVQKDENVLSETLFDLPNFPVSAFWGSNLGGGGFGVAGVQPVPKLPEDDHHVALVGLVVGRALRGARQG